MAAKRYGVADLVGVLADLAKPVADAWRDEGGPAWWRGVRAWAARKLRAVADQLAPAAVTLTVSVSVAVPAPVAAPEAAPAPEPAAPLTHEPTPTRIRKPATCKPAAKKSATSTRSKPVPAAARTTRAKAKPKAKAAKRPAPARKPAARRAIAKA